MNKKPKQQILGVIFVAVIRLFDGDAQRQKIEIVVEGNCNCDTTKGLFKKMKHLSFDIILLGREEFEFPKKALFWKLVVGLFTGWLLRSSTF